MKLLDVPGPYYLVTTLLNVKGLRVTPHGRNTLLIERDVRTLDRNNLILPEVLVENTEISVELAIVQL